MPNILDADGLQVATVPEITLALQTGFRGIYGNDINVEANSPDGQMIGIMAQLDSDLLRLLVQTYNSFSPDSAFGVTLDQRVAISGIQRKAGSYTIAQVQIEVSQAVTLTGQDALIANPSATVFTVQDDAGNPFQLVTTKAFGAAGVETLVFISSFIGVVQTLPNTINTITTTQLGVTSCMNPLFTVSTIGTVSVGLPQVTDIPSTAGMTPGMNFTGANVPLGALVLSVDASSQITLTVNATGSAVSEAITVATPPDIIGLPEETDPQLKARRARSFALQAVSPADALRAALLNLADVADAFIDENNTGGTVNGVPAHTIHVIVNGGTNTEIAQAIYAKKSPGCGMYGSVNQTVNRPQGSPFTATWDVAVSQPLYVRATLTPRITGQSFDVDADEILLAAALVYKMGQSPSIGDVVQAMAVIDPQAILSIVEVSDNGSTWTTVVSPTLTKNYFLANAANITLLNV